MIARLLKSEAARMPHLYLKEADDGTSAIEQLKNELQSQGGFDIIFMDSVMVQKYYLIDSHPKSS